MSTLQFNVDKDGIALITLDDQTKPMNVVSPEFMAEFSSAIERVVADAAIHGAVVTSAKPTFMAGADLKHILTLMERNISIKDAYEFSRGAQAMHRRMETSGKPFVAAINGLALGGGYELALACHHRVIVDDASAVVGLPEVTVGLMPGSGGTQRLPRLIGYEHATKVLLEGKTFAPNEALKLGMVDEVVAADELIDRARRWILASPESVRPWDRKGYKNVGGLLDASLAVQLAAHTAAINAKHQRNYPAPITILSAVFEGSVVPMDKALTLESKHFAKLLTDPIARNIVRTTFVNKNEAAKLARRPPSIPKRQFSKVGVLGAGMMGSGIAYVSALAGLDVVLLDSTAEFAAKGKAYSSTLLDRAVATGRRTRAQADSILARIEPSTKFSALSQCDIVIEAVFEDIGVKANVTAKCEAEIPVTAIFASNTSTLPISLLAKASRRPEQFIGLHFFSPVDRMPLVEVIVGKSTTAATLAGALDFVARLRMIPIVVNDSRGFYTSRVFQTFIHEGMKMLEDGIAPALIENAAKQAGFPIGPLALIDETTLELPWKIIQEAQAADGAAFKKPCSYEVMRRMLEEFERPGRKYGRGFYEYTTEGKRGSFWPGLRRAFPPSAIQPQIDELKRRFLYIQALETARCLEEGVLNHAADGDVGAILGWGFPAWTGGPLSLIDTVGPSRFVEECAGIAESLGPRFAPSSWLQELARRGSNFYSSGTV